jgi:hypothetical protein
MQLLYIDPGTGSLIFQALAAGIVSGLLYIKRIIKFVKGVFSKKEDKEGINL